MSHNQEAHIAYEEMVEAIQKYVQATLPDQPAMLTDWLMIAAHDGAMPLQTGYRLTHSYSPPHTINGLMDEARDIMTDTRLSMMEHARGECTCDDEDEEFL